MFVESASIIEKVEVSLSGKKYVAYLKQVATKRSINSESPALVIRAFIREIKMS